jgi:hypothetical protein
MAHDGHGTTITFGTSGFSANLIDVSGPSVERGSIDTTHMATASALTFIPADLYDPGGVELTFEFNGADNPPIDAVAETITIDWAGASGTGNWSGSGFMTNYKPGATIGERMTATATLKLTGPLSPVT